MRATPRISLALAATSLVVAGCTGPVVVNTDEAVPTVTSAAPPPPPQLTDTNLVNAFHYGAPVDGFTRYFFTSPSGRWQCVIVPRVRAGCQSTASAGLGVTGAPDTVPDGTGEPATPNAIVVNRDGDAHFAALDAAEFAPQTGEANTLEFNRILAAAGFRCNVQEAFGISCLSELSGKGFTFSADEFTWQYTDVPPGAP